MNSRRVAAASCSGVLALGLVATGTGAQWADSVTGAQSIETGTVGLKITGARAAEGSDPVAVSVTPDRKEAVFTVPLEDASFAFRQDLIVTNVGTLPLKDVSFEVTGSGDSPLVDSVQMRVNDAYDGTSAATGTVSALLGHVNHAGYTLQPWESTLLWFDFYTPDRAPWLSGLPALPSEAQGQSLTVTITFTGVDAPAGVTPLSPLEVRDDRGA